MRIAELRSENFKRLVAIDITPEGNVVQITGRNAQGKSSVLDSLAVAIEGLEACPGEPIRKGEKSGKIRVKLAGEKELIVTRKFARKEEGGFTSSLTVESPDGAQYKSPQKLLDDLLGELTIDPLEFLRMKQREQFDAMASFVPGVDFVAIDGQNRADFERRTVANRQARDARGAANSITIPDGTPDEAIDEKALTTELQAAGTLNQDVERRSGLRAQAIKDVQAHRDRAAAIIVAVEPWANKRRADCVDKVDEVLAEIERLKLRIDALHAEAAADITEYTKKSTADAAVAMAAADELQARLDDADPLPPLIDTAALAERINQARETNAQVERKRQRATHVATAEKYEAEADMLTKRIDDRNDDKHKAIAAAQMPVAGLGFGDGVVLLNGVPFDQASSAERLRTSCAIAMAKNPRLRVCCIRDGSLLDEDGLRLIGEMAEANDFQIFVEKVDSSGKLGICIEDGRVAASKADAA
jgi:hypothetical protein